MTPGLMMNRPLMISDIIEFAAEAHPAATITSVSPEEGVHRYTYGAARERIRRLAGSLPALGVRPGDRVATLALNGHRHLELYYGIAGIGAVCHTLNPRYAPHMLQQVIATAGDRVLFFEPRFWPLVARIELPPGCRLVAMTDDGRLAQDMRGLGVTAYETLLEEARAIEAWPVLDEATAAGLCHTSGTTGRPKGVLYSQRSTVLHALMSLASGLGAFADASRTILPVVPLFHVNAWGLPHSAPLRGNPLVLPGPALDGASLFGLMDRERVHSAWGVPTVWVDLLAEMRRQGRRPEGLSEVLVGGAAPSPAMIRAFEDEFGVGVVQGWGMTEMSPLGTLSPTGPALAGQSREEAVAATARQGRRVFGVELRIVDASGRDLPRDGAARGELLVRGHAVAAGYLDDPEATADAFAEGWFRTGDIATIAPDGTLAVVDRTKDVIKSGGEWISSLEIEAAASGIEGLGPCAAVAVPDSRWGERPVLVVAGCPASGPSEAEILAQLSARLERWKVPDRVHFVAALPLSANGKVAKAALRRVVAAPAEPVPA